MHIFEKEGTVVIGLSPEEAEKLTEEISKHVPLNRFSGTEDVLPELFLRLELRRKG